MDTTGTRIRAARMAKGLSLGKLAKAVGVDKSTIQRIETGADCRAETLGKVARVLGVTSDSLLYGDARESA